MGFVALRSVSSRVYLRLVYWHSVCTGPGVVAGPITDSAMNERFVERHARES